MAAAHLDPADIRFYPRQAAALTRYAEQGEPHLRVELERWAATLKARRVHSPDGPVFSFRSDARANKRLFQLRLDACFGGELEAALSFAVQTRECVGELELIVALIADKAGHALWAGAHERPLLSVGTGLLAAAPRLLEGHMATLLEWGPWTMEERWELLGVLPWDELLGAQWGKRVVLLGRAGRLLVSMEGEADAKRGSFRCKVARTPARVPMLWRDTKAEVQKQHRIELGDASDIWINGFNAPAPGEQPLAALMRHGNRAGLLRQLRADPPRALEGWSGLGGARAPLFLLDLMNAGVALPEPHEGALGWLRQLQAHLLPRHFGRLLFACWGEGAKGVMAQLKG